MGDVIHGVPTLCALRKANPNAFIGWVVEGRMGDLLEGHPALDVARSRAATLAGLAARGMATPTTTSRPSFRYHDRPAMLDQERAVAAWLSGSRRRIGKSGPDGRELSPWLHNEFVEPGGQHVIEHYLSMLKPLGVESTDVRFDFPERRNDARMADDFCAGSSFRPDTSRF